MEKQEVGAVSYAFTQETGLKLACAAEDSKVGIPVKPIGIPN